MKKDEEIIASHRRTKACELLNLEKIFAFIGDLVDEKAILFMVDSNIQQEEILPSERAFDYKMKLDLMRKEKEKLDNSSNTTPKPWIFLDFWVVF